MRIAFSIIHNGLHHLKHNNQFSNILDSCDAWVVVEGASLSNGSTRWCKDFPEHLHQNGGSNDGTREFLRDLAAENEKLIYVPSDGFWNSKDDQVNRAIDEVRRLANNCFLWEIDIDEQWTSEQMDQAEKELMRHGSKAGCFRSKCFVGENLRAVGEWGEARSCGYTRLWMWEGESFICHEPPVLDGLMGVDPTMLSPVFRHYNYYFEKDVLFKDQWYGGHENIHERWRLLNLLDKRCFPVHISNLITGPWGNSNSAIVWEERQGKIVQIGSHDGMDEVREMVKEGLYSCLLVEPNPTPFSHLEHNYSFTKNCIFENCAVSDHDGEICIHFSTFDSAVSNSMHSSVDLAHVLRHGTPPENIDTQRVKCFTLHSLLEKHGWDREEVDHLYIDAEGHDCDIILSTDFSRLNISSVTFETTHTDGAFMRGEKFERTVRHLDGHGYFVNARMSTSSDLTMTKRRHHV
jgi:FkbM family methyltransferase